MRDNEKNFTTTNEITTPVPASNRWWALVVLCLVQFMLVVDTTVVNVALPTIKHELGFSQPDLAWVINSYVLAFGGFLLLGGRLGDLFGREQIFIRGQALFTLASLADGLALNPIMLVASRAVQGLGAALISPSALALVTTLFQDPKERVRALSIWGSLGGLGGTTGVLLSGVITDLVSWRWVFFINLPFGGLALLLIPLLVAKSLPTAKGGFDLAGAMCVTGGLTTLVYGLLTSNHLNKGGNGDGFFTAGIFILAILLLASFIFIEAHIAYPLVPLNFFRQRSIGAALVISFIVAASFNSMFFLLTLYLQQVLAYSPLTTGLAYLGLTVGLFTGIATSSQLVPRLGVRPVLTCGLLANAAGLCWFGRLPVEGNYWSDVLPAMLLASFGGGWSAVPVTIAVVTKVRKTEAGLASGILNSSQQLGAAVGLAVFVSLATNRITDFSGAGVAINQAAPQVEGSHLAFLTVAALELAGAVMALAFLGSTRPTITTKASQSAETP